MPAPRRRPPSSRAALLAVLAALALAAGGREAWRRETEEPRRDPGLPPVTLGVPPGASAEWIARQLHALGFVRHPLVFRVLVYLRGDSASLRAGEYALASSDSLVRVVDKLVRGEVVRHDVTFPEGKNLAEAAQIAGRIPGRKVDAAAFLAAARDPSPIRDLDPLAEDLEGYLFPDTYEVPRSDDAAARLVLRMVERFRGVVDPELPRVRAAKMTVRELVTLASLVELETAREDERPRIAAVFLNRLARGMLLQTDPTVIYALKQKGTWNGNIRLVDLAIASPYNTYRVTGLPPGPIASPGREALLAVLAPAPVKDLYFVSRNDGSHQFSETLAEHNRAVNLYQRRRGARGVS